MRTVARAILDRKFWTPYSQNIPFPNEVNSQVLGCEPVVWRATLNSRGIMEILRIYRSEVVISLISFLMIAPDLDVLELL